MPPHPLQSRAKLKSSPTIIHVSYKGHFGGSSGPLMKVLADRPDKHKHHPPAPASRPDTEPTGLQTIYWSKGTILFLGADVALLGVCQGRLQIPEGRWGVTFQSYSEICQRSKDDKQKKIQRTAACQRKVAMATVAATKKTAHPAFLFIILKSVSQLE